MKRAPALSESHIKNTCTEWLALDGWRFIDTDPPGLRGLGVREKGIADRLYLRYWNSGDPRDVHGRIGKGADQIGEILWIEWKRQRQARYSKKEQCWIPTQATHDQNGWILAERARGALVWLAGVDFPASIEGFQECYRNSGLMRTQLR